MCVKAGHTVHSFFRYRFKNIGGSREFIQAQAKELKGN